ncbi:unnamed protein product [Microthlaspi erraticum]|uniref:FBD domain-containing protein n=1 Tax=Microthlaspi erraticum TaxID=1685480 RepID=A0A6D2KZG2_9BRAS|nr:unnamed protein product [Microthlaspi erraticum]
MANIVSCRKKSRSGLVEEDEVGISRKEDRISLLHESLQCHILSFLTTQESVRTSAFSSAWRHLWKYFPRFRLCSFDIPNDEVGVDVIDKYFMNFQSESCLHEFDLCIYSEHTKKDASLYESCLGKLIKRKIQRFKVEWFRDMAISLSSLPVCETLVSLKLLGVKLNDFGSLSFPCLKIMNLRYVTFPEPLVLDTPRLEELILRSCEFEFKSFKIISMSSSVKLDLDVDFALKHYDLSERNIIYNFFNKFSHAKNMTLSMETLEVNIYYLHHMNPLPKFHDLTRLCASMSLNTSAEILPFVLESCPNLKHLNLELVKSYTEEDAEVDTSFPSKLPSCLVSSLECVEIISDITEEARERKVVRYFLDNATKLKKLVLRLYVYGEKPHNFGLLKQQFDSPRRSGFCHFEVLPMV